MAYRKRICYLCGAKYEYCGTCYEDRHKPAFMATFHDENCKNVFDTCTKYNMNLMTKEEAKDALLKCDLTNKANFMEDVQKDIKNIMAEEPKKEEIPSILVKNK